jgi:uncharacterized protein (DUF488 family)
MTGASSILTIGHSNHSAERFVELLNSVGVTAIADVRSVPVSRFAPHFNKEALATLLSTRSVLYRFLGNALGGRPTSPSMFTAGIADYEKMASQESFRAAMAKLIEATQRHRIALMCAEADPLDCHRCLLIGRALVSAGVDVGHILASGEIMTHGKVEDRLLEDEELTETSLLFKTHQERLTEAYRSRSRKVAFAENVQKPVGMMVQR